MTNSILLLPLEDDDLALIQAARNAVLPLVNQLFEGERITSVGAAARWSDGHVFVGANVKHPSSGPSCMCAEQVVLSSAYNETYTRDLDVIVAYWYEGNQQENVINPCGRCRDYMRLFGNPWIIVRDGDIWTSRKWGRVRLANLHVYSNSWEK